MNEIIAGICPFGCKPSLDGETPSDFDDLGYCKHLVGFITLTNDQRAPGRLFERLEGVEEPEKDDEGNFTGRKVHTGVMRVTGKKREKVLDTDEVWGPEEIQRRLTTRNAEGAVTFKPRLGISSRVYRSTGETRVVTGPDIEQHEARLRRIEDLKAQLEEDQQAIMEFERRKGGADLPTEQTAEQNLKEERSRKPVAV